MKISACVITKNEENNLPQCLNSVKSLVSEIVVVDTGSTDRTVEIAKEYGAKVFHFTWIDDFAAAKNYAISQATGDWIVFLDADEYFSEESISRLPYVIKKANKDKADLIIGLISHYDKESKKMFLTSPQVRIFRKDPNIQYVGAIHERLVGKEKKVISYDASTEITIIHTGYSPDVLRDKRKSERNLELLFKEWEKSPNRSDLAFYISEAYLVGDKLEEGLTYAKKVLQFKNATLQGLYEKNYLNIIRCMIKLEYSPIDILKTIDEAILSCPTVPDYHFFQGDIFRQQHRLHDAIYAFQKGLSKVSQNLSSPTIAFFSIGTVYVLLGQLYYYLLEVPTSVECFVNALRINKYDYAALKNLIDIFTRYETTENTIQFLTKLYDEENWKDVLMLVSVSADARNAELMEYYMKKLPDSVELQDKHANLSYLKGDYQAASNSYLQLYKQTGAEDCAIKALASAQYSDSPELLECIYSQLPQTYRQMVSTAAEEEIDTSVLLQVIDEHIKMKQWEKLLDCADVIEKNGLLGEVAELLYQNEEYRFALDFYDIYLQNATELQNEQLVKILVKVAKCLYMNNETNTALKVLEDAQELNPFEYAVYEHQLLIQKKLQDSIGAQQTARAALAIFPDSEFLKMTCGMVYH